MTGKMQNREKTDEKAGIGQDRDKDRTKTKTDRTEEARHNICKKNKIK